MTTLSPHSITVKLLSQRGAEGFSGIEKRLPGGTLNQGDITLTTNPDEPADVVLIQNYLKYDEHISARRGFIWKWDNEPIVRHPFPQGVDRFFTHLSATANRDIVTAPPILDWWVNKSYDELKNIDQPEKNRLISAIASTKDWINGHRLRADFIKFLESSDLSVDVFGHGRSIELDDKWDGLAPYKYSVAIENSSKPDYWTEKIADCFLAFTVPFYWGATNLAEYFPEDSFVWIPIEDPQKALSVIRQEFQEGNYSKRLEALAEARRRILDEYSLGAQILKRVRLEREEILNAPPGTFKVQGRRTRPHGWNRSESAVANLQHQLRRLAKLVRLT